MRSYCLQQFRSLAHRSPVPREPSHRSISLDPKTHKFSPKLSFNASKRRIPRFCIWFFLSTKSCHRLPICCSLYRMIWADWILSTPLNGSTCLANWMSTKTVSLRDLLRTVESVLSARTARLLLTIHTRSSRDRLSQSPIVFSTTACCSASVSNWSRCLSQLLRKRVLAVSHLLSVLWVCRVPQRDFFEPTHCRLYHVIGK